jgi:hypothetical protein
MTKLLTSVDDYNGAIEVLLEKRPKSVSIATYCIGNIRALAPFDGISTRVLVGVPRNIKREHAISYDELPGFFPKMSFKFSRFSHAKCLIFQYTGLAAIAIMGGRNLSASASHDVSIMVGQPISGYLLNAYNLWWDDLLTFGSAKNCWRDRLGKDVK